MSQFSYQTVDFTMWLPLYASCNAIYTYVDKLTTLVKIIPCVVGDGGIYAAATAKLFIYYAFCIYKVS